MSNKTIVYVGSAFLLTVTGVMLFSVGRQSLISESLQADLTDIVDDGQDKANFEPGHAFPGLLTSKEYVIELSEDGFSPPEISIQRGDTVKFVTVRDKSFWPASSLHPTHTIYSEFDPRKPVDPKESCWEYACHKRADGRQNRRTAKKRWQYTSHETAGGC